MAQIVCGMETSEEVHARGKSDDLSIVVKDCIVTEDLQTQLFIFKESSPTTLPAIITFQRQSVQMFFSPETAVAHFKRNVKELWDIPSKMYYLLINGVHQGFSVTAWPKCSGVQVVIRSSGAGKSGKLSLFLEGEEIRCRTNQTFREAIEDRDIKIKGFCVSTHDGIVADLDEMIGHHFQPGSEVELILGRTSRPVCGTRCIL
jgi:hypothetical protein